MTRDALPKPQDQGLDTNVERAHRLLRASILSGAVQQGSRLSEVRLAKEMGFSRGPIREALRGLEQEGLVTTVPNRATFVRRITPIQVLEALEVRALMEPTAFDAARKRRRDGLGARLNRVLGDMRSRLESEDVGALAALHGRFHAVLYQEAPNRVLLRVWEQTESVTELHVLTRLATLEDGQRLLEEHVELASALTGGSVADGRQAIVEHLTIAARNLGIPSFDGDLTATLQERVRCA